MRSVVKQSQHQQHCMPVVNEIQKLLKHPSSEGAVTRRVGCLAAENRREGGNGLCLDLGTEELCWHSGLGGEEWESHTEWRLCGFPVLYCHIMFITLKHAVI